MKKSRIAALGITVALSAGLVGWGTFAPADEVMGVITADGAAAIAVSDQVGASRSVTIDMVRAPRDSFVVVHQSDGGMPGERVGYAPVKKGVTRKVTVELDKDVPLTPELLAAVHVDGGIRGKLEFDMEDLDRSTDKPYFIGGKEVAVAFNAAEFGVPVGMGEASIEAADQPLGSKVTVGKAVAPTDAFVVIHKAKADGMPGERLGFAAIKAGETSNVEVKLDKQLKGRTKLLAAIHADRGDAGKLEFDMEAPVDSPDQPFFADGMEVAVAFTVGPFGVETDSASITAADQIGAEGTLVIEEVDAPADSWVVVHKDAGGTLGERVGLARVDEGVTKGVKVELTAEMLPENLIVALHADRVDAEVFEFDMMEKFDSPDQPYFVDGKEVASVIKVREFGYPTPIGTSSIIVEPQVVEDALLRVGTAVAPEDSWIVVHLDAGGMPGGRVGLLRIPAGITQDVIVQLDASKKLTDTLFVAVHADRGEAEMFEFDMMDKVNSPDQPFFVDGAEVATAVTIR